MKEEQKHIEALHDIKDMMNRSSRFISLSGLSGISAGICALAATIYIWPVWLSVRGQLLATDEVQTYPTTDVQSLLVTTGVVTFFSALDCYQN